MDISVTLRAGNTPRRFVACGKAIPEQVLTQTDCSLHAQEKSEKERAAKEEAEKRVVAERNHCTLTPSLCVTSPKHVTCSDNAQT